MAWVLVMSGIVLLIVGVPVALVVGAVLGFVAAAGL